MDIKQPVEVGRRIVLIRMHGGPDPVKPGTMGTVQRVQRVDDDWVIGMQWDDGRPCALVFPGDRFIIENEEIIELESAIVFDFPSTHKPRSKQIPLFVEVPDPVCTEQCKTCIRSVDEKIRSAA